jgi:hypothetical protein
MTTHDFAPLTVSENNQFFLPHHKWEENVTVTVADSAYTNPPCIVVLQKF